MWLRILLLKLPYGPTHVPDRTEINLSLHWYKLLRMTAATLQLFTTNTLRKAVMKVKWIRFTQHLIQHRRVWEIYHPSEWDVIRRNARVKQPYKIFNLSQDDEVPVYNLKQFCKAKIINRNKYEDDNGKVVKRKLEECQSYF